MKRNVTEQLERGEFDVVDEPSPPPAEVSKNPEEIQRIQVDAEDRVAFRVGVNILTLTLVGLGAWLLWSLFRG